MKKLLRLSVISLFLLSQSISFARSDTMDDVHLFQSFFRDAPIAAVPYGEGFLSYGDSDFIDVVDFGIRGGAALTPKFELSGAIFGRNIDIDNGGDGETGLADIPVFGRYNFYAEELKFSAGGFLTLPVGSEDIGESNFDLGVFGAARYPLSDEVVLTGNVGIDLLESQAFGSDDREAQLNLGGGVIYAATEQVSVLGELVVESETDNTAISGGLDYELAEIGRLRGNLLVGLDDGAPDLGITVGFLVNEF